MKAARLDPATNFPGAVGGVAGDPFDAGLVSRLFQEVISELTQGVPGPALPGGGEPVALPGSDSFTPPPVHPVFTVAAPGRAPAECSAPSTPALRSGGHNPHAEDTQAFGEPRCSPERFGESGLSSQPGASSSHSRSPLATPPSVPAIIAPSPPCAVSAWKKAVRPSFAFYNTREEIDVLIRALHQLPRR